MGGIGIEGSKVTQNQTELEFKTNQALKERECIAG